MAFEDLVEFADDHLDLPIRGKVYRIPSPPFRVGIRCTTMADIARRRHLGLPVSDAEVASLQVDDEGEQDWNRSLLGSAYDELLADDVPVAMVKHVVATVFAWVSRGRATAETVWGSNRPEAPTPAKTSASSPSAPQGSPAGSTTTPRSKTSGA